MRTIIAAILILLALSMEAYLFYDRHFGTITVICDANTETPINSPTEYPAWTLECDSNHITVVVID